MSAKPVSSANRWRSRAPDEIVWFDIAPDFVAFHRPSGKTHFLNAASKLLLTDTLIEPANLPSILGAISSGSVDETVEDYQQQMIVMLEHFESLGLVERV